MEENLYNLQADDALLGVASIVPFLRNDSASRVQMAGSQLGQALPIIRPEARKVMTGVEYELGEHCYHIRMPVTGRVIGLYNRYAPILDDGQAHAPSQTLVFEDTTTGEIGSVEIVRYQSHSSHFCYSYVPGEGAEMMTPGQVIPKDTILMRVNCVDDHGAYRFGVNANVAYMAVPGVSDDSIVASESCMRKYAYTILETVCISWGPGKTPLNLYGNESNYKIFPDIGETLPTGMPLMALRSTQECEDDTLGPIMLHNKATRKIDYGTDTLFCVPDGSRVVDVVIYHDPRQGQILPSDAQPLRYYQGAQAHATKIVDLYNRIMRNNPNVSWGDAMHRAVHSAMTILAPARGADAVSKVYKQNPIGKWTAWITVALTCIPAKGAKFTDQHGGKGVVSAVWPDEDMPVDQWGVRADFIQDPVGTMNRMNVGRTIEQYMYAAALTLDRHMSEITGVALGTTQHRSKPVLSVHPDKVRQAYECWREFHTSINPVIKKWDEVHGLGDPLDVVTHVLQHGTTVYLRNDNGMSATQVLDWIDSSPYKPAYGPVRYRDDSGEFVTTKADVRIAQTYIFALNKTGTSANAAGFGPVTPMGTPASLTGANAYSSPVRKQPSRAFGEAETRGMGAHAAKDNGEELLAEIFDRNNNPASVELCAAAVITADKPTRITRIIDREKHPYNPRPVAAALHMLACAGIELTYDTYEEQ
jgi:hypothetical protein